jgi:hypothetical protein
MLGSMSFGGEGRTYVSFLNKGSYKMVLKCAIEMSCDHLTNKWSLNVSDVTTIVPKFTKYIKYHQICLSLVNMVLGRILH